MEKRQFTNGDILKHFKREYNSEGSLYLYRFIGKGIHTETGEILAIYQALYGTCEIYIRPIEEFYSRVDRDKYPDIMQVYRFEKHS